MFYNEEDKKFIVEIDLFGHIISSDNVENGFVGINYVPIEFTNNIYKYVNYSLACITQLKRRQVVAYFTGVICKN